MRFTEDNTVKKKEPRLAGLPDSCQTRTQAVAGLRFLIMYMAKAIIPAMTTIMVMASSGR